MSNIIRIPVGGTTYTNTGSQIGNGMEMEGHWRVNRRLNLSASLAHQRSIDQATQQDAGYAPRNTAYLRADWQAANDWQLSAQANRVADRKRPAGDARRPIPDYTTVDLTARTRLGHDWQFMGSIRNLFDAKVLEPSLAPGLAIPNDLPMPGRTLYFQLQYKLN
jgi:iron complex outermembrane receptor protein